MAFNQSRIVGPTTLATSTNSTTAPVSNLYEVPVGETTIIKQLVLSNLTASAKTVTVWLVPSGASPASSNIVFHDLLVNANETTLVNLSLVMEESGGTGDRIFARCSASSAVNITVNAVVEDGT